MAVLPEGRKAIEKAAREAICEKLQLVPGINNVFSRQRYSGDAYQMNDLAGYDDLIDGVVFRTGRMASVELDSFTDESTHGLCNDLTFTYRIKVVHSFIDDRGDGTNSYDDFVGVMLDACDLFANDIHLGYDDLYQDSLLQIEIADTDLDAETGKPVGHYGEMTITVGVEK